jgi:alpha-L-fucosidase
MDLYHKAGARYFVAQAMHHDHFFNYDSKLNRMNSTKVGPMKDICALWKKAADRHGMPFGLTEHLGATFSWWKVNKWSDAYGPYAGVPYDGNDPEYRDFYLDNYEHADDKNPASSPWYTKNSKYHDYWLSVFKEVVDLFQPELMYTDGTLPFGDHWHVGDSVNDAAIVGVGAGGAFRCGLEAVSYLYNASIMKNGKNNAIYLQKNRSPEIYNVGIVDLEKSQMAGAVDYPWHTDTCIGNWFYDAKMPFKKPGHIVEMIVDIASKNGSMLLNILQLPDGTIDDETRFILDELADWYKVCGEGLYGTRPYKVYGEGGAKVLIEGFREDRTNWGADDFRFTRKAGNVYAFIMKADETGVCVLRSLADERVKSVRLLDGGVGADGGGRPLEFAQTFGVLTVKLPGALPCKFANCLKIEV